MDPRPGPKVSEERSALNVPIQYVPCRHSIVLSVKSGDIR